MATPVRALADPHRVFIDGPTPLHAADMEAPPALRPATIILIGMLAAEGESMLRDVYPINRGYERLHERLTESGVGPYRRASRRWPSSSPAPR